MIDYLIVGQGLAGSLLAYELIQRKKHVHIVDDDHKKSSSIISAGIINPVTGKRFAITPQFDMFFDCAIRKYDELRMKFGARFFESKPILRIFQDESEQAHWQRKDDLNLALDYCQKSNEPFAYNPGLSDPLGSVLIGRSGFCYTATLLNTFKEYFQKKKCVSSERFLYDDLKLEQNNVMYKGDKYKTVIFCEGFQAQFNPWFEALLFNSVKGEILTIEMEMEMGSLSNVIINKGKWCAPLNNGKWMAGATYRWDAIDCEPTEEGRKEIVEALNENFCQREIRVINQKAAVRPVMADQKVVLGRHPEIPSLAIFNGLGSKGFLTAPYYASVLADYLDGICTIQHDISVGRFYSGIDTKKRNQ